MVLGPKAKNETINIYGFWGVMHDMMEAIPGTFHMEPPKAIWCKITEDRKLDWHVDVQMKKI